jgi:hypothetical protein
MTYVPIADNAPSDLVLPSRHTDPGIYRGLNTDEIDVSV